MTDNAAVDQTPAPEGVTEEKELSPRELLEQAYDTASAEAEEAPQEAEETPEQAEDAPQEDAPKVEAPTDLPGPLRAHWASLPEDARDAFVKSQREMSEKVSSVNREMQAIGPIRDVVLRAARELPEVSKMPPKEIANQIWGLFQAGQALQKNPEEAFKGLARQHGIDLAKLAGQPGDGKQDAPQAAQNEIRELKQQIAQQNQMLRQYADPQYIRQQIEGFHTETNVTGEVQKFSAEAEHWATVEPELPKFIQAVKVMSPDAAPSQVLQEAYEMAVNRLGLNTRAAESVGEEPTPNAPERVKQAVKAKSVNVSSKPTGKAKPSDPKQAMAAVYDRMMND